MDGTRATSGDVRLGPQADAGLPGVRRARQIVDVIDDFVGQRDVHSPAIGGHVLLLFKGHHLGICDGERLGDHEECATQCGCRGEFPTSRHDPPR
ncbi:Uncharacterised protein [Mycobacteroides abscessus subsp. massiliense]|nr:Uncharacterised protein [Mycobacteroides abscessus subsp. massiliense]